MQVAEILVRRTIRFVFFGGEGKKGPAAKEKSSKVENKEKKRGKKNIPRRSQRVRDFLSLSLSLSRSFFSLFFFRASSSRLPQRFRVQKKKKKGNATCDWPPTTNGEPGFFFCLAFLFVDEGNFCLFCFFFVFLSFSNAVSDWLSATWPNQSGASFHWESSMGSANGTVSTMRDPVKNNSIKRRNSGRSFLLPVRMIFNHGQDDDEKLGKRTTR